MLLQMSTVIANPKGTLFYPYDIAIDPYSRRLYWSDQKNNVINVTRLDLISVGVVVSSENNQQPRKIALAPKDG